MVSLKFFTVHHSFFSRFLRLLVFVVVFYSFASTQVFAQQPPYAGFCTGATPPAVCSTCVGSPNVDACGWCKSGNFNAPGVPPDTCRIAVSGYNTSLPKDLKLNIEANADYERTGRMSFQNLNKQAWAGGASNIITGAVGGGVDANGNVTIGPAIEGVNYAYRTDGAVGSIIAYTDKIIRPPVSSTEYIAYVKDSFSHPLGAQPAYAQGLGFSSLSPVLGLWKIFRNVAYFFFVVIFVVIGFLIMFRSKIGGQAAVTVQQALPKIIVSLLLVTFSYAIVGLMVDIMYLIIYLMIGIFSSGPNGLDVASLTKIAFSNSIFANGFGLLKTTDTVAGLLKDLVVQVLTGLGWADFTALGIGLAVDLVALLVLSVALIVSLFRIFFGLLQAYVGIFFSVILAPIQLLMGAIPGQNTFGAWIRGIWTNLAVFPVVIFFIFAAHYFAEQSNLDLTVYNTGSSSLAQSLPLSDVVSQANAQGIAPLQTGITTGAGGQIASAFIIFGILATLPKSMEIAKSIASGKFEFGDVGKNIGEMWKTGKDNSLTKSLALAPINVPVGAAVGAIGARRLTKGKPYQGIATLAGGLIGGFGGGATRLPTKLGVRMAGDVVRLGSETVTRLGLQSAQERLELQQARSDAERAKEAQQAASAAPTKPAATPAYKASAGKANYKDKWK